MTEITKDNIEIERQELDLLIQRGISFEVERVIYKRPKGLLGWLRKGIPEKQLLRYKVEEPTLSTLDRISAEAIELSIDESKMQSSGAINEARKLTQQHSHRLARIVAIAVLGQDYVHITQEGPRARYRYDNKSLERLTNLFFHNVKPSKLVELVGIISTMSNLGDFCNSIRLMSANRTTMPIRIEAEED